MPHSLLLIAAGVLPGLLFGVVIGLWANRPPARPAPYRGHLLGDRGDEAD